MHTLARPNCEDDHSLGLTSTLWVTNPELQESHARLLGKRLMGQLTLTVKVERPGSTANYSGPELELR